MMCLFLSATLFLASDCHISPDLGGKVMTYVAQAGYKPDAESVKAIVKASELYDINPIDMTRIAMLESSFDKSKRHLNENGTIDSGLFQVNDVQRSGTCKEFDIDTLDGNVMCAAKIIKGIKIKWGRRDPRWIARYHSKTPALKYEYYRKLASL
jgi:hypothetical protein